MRHPLRRQTRQYLQDLHGGFVLRPLLTALALGAYGVVLPLIEEHYPGIDRWVATLPVLVSRDVGSAQSMLGAILGAVMTVVSIVLSVLLVALTIASAQFSPRLLSSFVQSRITQQTIGLFLGTFLYGIAVYPAVHGEPSPSIPVLALLCAIGLAVSCAVCLLVFIQHISRSINASYIADRIAGDTERIIDEVLPDRADHATPREPSHPHQTPAAAVFDKGTPVLATRSGYLRFIDGQRLAEVAQHHDVVVRIERASGTFIAEGTALLRLSSSKKLDTNAASELLETVDIGPMRTLQGDIVFGVLQLVDIALRALSPAINDPTTAITSIDQLTRLLIRVAGRKPQPSVLYLPQGTPRVVLVTTPFPRLLNIAFNQIRHYGRADMVICLRLARALSDIAACTREPSYLAAISTQASYLCEAAEKCFNDDELTPLRARVDVVFRLTTGCG